MAIYLSAWTLLFPSLPKTDNIAAKGVSQITQQHHRHFQGGDSEIDGLWYNTYFSFVGKFYWQLWGLLIGTSLSSSIACIYLEYFENKVQASYKQFHQVFVRYIDNIFIVWEMGGGNDYFLWPSQHPRIQFTVEKESEGRLNYLNVRDSNRLSLQVFRKPINTGVANHRMSAHYPLHSACSSHIRSAFIHSSNLRYRLEELGIIMILAEQNDFFLSYCMHYNNIL